MNVYVNAVVKEFDLVFDVKSRILRRITEFIDPTGGNFNGQGWEIGTVPNNMQVLNALKDIKDIRFIKSVRCAAFIRGASGMVEVDLEREEARKFVLPVSGKHEILVEVV
jgi:hypothetical protein